MAQQNLRTTRAFENVVVDPAVANCTELPYEDYGAGQVLVPTGYSGTLNFYGAESAGTLANDGPKNATTGLRQNYLPCYDVAGNPAVLNVVAGRAYPIPAACQGYAALKIVGTSGTLIVCLKS